MTDWTTLSNKLKTTAEAVCGYTNPKRRKRETWWWNEDIEKLVTAKRTAYFKWKVDRSRELWNEYKTCRNNAKMAIRKAISDASEQACKDADGKRLFAIAKSRAKDQLDVVGSNCIRDAIRDGKLLMSVESRKKVWKKHFEGIMNVENEWIAEPIPAISGPVLDFTTAEVETAIACVNGSKAAGPSGINVTMIKAAGEVAVNILRDVANRIVSIMPCRKTSSTAQ